jgi:hypothetical protein
MTAGCPPATTCSNRGLPRPAAVVPCTLRSRPEPMRGGYPLSDTRSRTQHRSILDRLAGNPNRDLRTVLNQVADSVVDPASDCVGARVRAFQSTNSHEEVALIVGILVERIFQQGCLRTTIAVGAFGIRALTPIRLAFLTLHDQKCQRRLVQLAESLAPNLTESEYVETMNELTLWPRLAHNQSAKDAVADAARTLRRCFEARSRSAP